MIACARSIVCLAVGAACAITDANAGIVIGATRIVFPGASRDVAVRVENKGQEPALVQAWIDDGDDRSTPENAHAPFAITPPVFRIDAGQGHALRIVHVGNHPPADREVVYWLNVLEIPPSPDAAKTPNTLQFAFRHRLKLLHRPSNLSVEPAAAASLLAWSIDTDGAFPRLHVRNPSPYVLSFNEVAIMGAESPGKAFPLGGGMVAAEGDARWPWPKGVSLPTDAAVRFTTINDYGALVSGTAKVTAAPAVND